MKLAEENRADITIAYAFKAISKCGTGKSFLTNRSTHIYQWRFPFRFPRWPGMEPDSCLLVSWEAPLEA
jgi:hypothetical protein